MTTSIPRFVVCLALISTFFAPTLSINAQIGVNASSNQIQNEVEKQDPRINEIIKKAEDHFKNGEASLAANKRYEAKPEFDAAIDVILNAGIDVRGNPRLNKYYYELIERIYRIEVPQQQQNVAPANNSVTMVAVSLSGQTKDGEEKPPIGFGSQDFVKSGDELAQIKLTPTEEIPNPEVEDIVKKDANTTSLGFVYHADPRIGQFINYYMGARGRTTMEVGIKRSGQFMKMARKIFREEGVPEDIVWLGQVESAWLPWNQSWAGASGLWQFIRSTGSRFDLQQTAYLDERNGFEKATRASAKYLKWLADRYGGNWELAMGAYNCGEGNVDRAIARAGRSDFWAAYPYLPTETRNYVPNILAVIIINKNPTKFGFGHVRPLPPLTYDVVQMPGGTSLKTIATLTDSTHDWLRYLNPELRQATTPKGMSYAVRIPAGKAKDLVARFKQLPADKRTATNQVQEISINRAKPVMAPTGTGKYVTQKGETLRKVASKLGISATELARANGVANPDAELKVGRQLRLPTQVSNPRRSK